MSLGCAGLGVRPGFPNGSKWTLGPPSNPRRPSCGPVTATRASAGHLQDPALKTPIPQSPSPRESVQSPSFFLEGMLIAALGVEGGPNFYQRKSYNLRDRISRIR